MTERERIDFDVLFVGGGPACLAGAIHLMRKAAEAGVEVEAGLIEKGAEIGAHAVSGAVINPIALQELLSDNEYRDLPIESIVEKEAFYFLTSRRAFRIPVVPRYMENRGYPVVSLSRFSRKLGEIAEEAGVNIFPGFAGVEVLYGPDGKTITGVRTDDKGRDPKGDPKGNFEPGIDIHAKVTVFGEGARGSLVQDIDKRHALFSETFPPVFETGIKEVIRLPAEDGAAAIGADCIHFLGYPLISGIDLSPPGGGFLYKMSDDHLALGYLTALSYSDPGLDPYEVFIRFKRHPYLARLLQGGRVVEQGARTVSVGGYYTLSKLFTDGALFIGGAAGFQNPPALKGVHLSMKSGMAAAEACLTALEKGDADEKTLSVFKRKVDESYIQGEMRQGRNFARALSKPHIAKLIHLGAQYVTRGAGVTDPMVTFPDASTLTPAAGPPQPLDKSVYDGEQVIDKLTGVYLSKTMHREDQPCHIIVHDRGICETLCREKYQNPCTRFCPGQVYEFTTDEARGKETLKINFANCLHCKTCDIKDPFDNITWTCPEGGEGPGYTMV